jgi:hypothetical protein
LLQVNINPESTNFFNLQINSYSGTVLISNVEIVTAITIILIGVIVTIYLLVLKKNGWIGRTSNYRCPNPECNKIFHSTLKVNDFSNKRITRLACPECGYDLGSSKDEKTLLKKITQNEADPKNRDSDSIDKIENNISNTHMQCDELEMGKADLATNESNQNQNITELNSEESKEIILKPETRLEGKDSASILGETQSSMRIKESEETKGLQNGLENIKLLKKSNFPKKRNNKIKNDAKIDRPVGCNNYFGYLSTHPRGTATPDECYACPKLIDCYKEPSVRN